MSSNDTFSDYILRLSEHTCSLSFINANGTFASNGLKQGEDF